MKTSIINGSEVSRLSVAIQFDETVTPVCSPSFLEKHNVLTEIKELFNCVLLHENRMQANWKGMV